MRARGRSGSSTERALPVRHSEPRPAPRPHCSPISIAAAANSRARPYWPDPKNQTTGKSRRYSAHNRCGLPDTIPVATRSRMRFGLLDRERRHATKLRRAEASGGCRAISLANVSPEIVLRRARHSGDPDSDLSFDPAAVQHHDGYGEAAVAGPPPARRPVGPTLLFKRPVAQKGDKALARQRHVDILETGKAKIPAL